MWVYPWRETMKHCWYCNDELDEGEGGRIEILGEPDARICDSTDCWVAHWRRESGLHFENPDLSLPRSVLARVCGVRK
jgi:hypothetical protein